MNHKEISLCELIVSLILFIFCLEWVMGQSEEYREMKEAWNRFREKWGFSDADLERMLNERRHNY